MRKLAAVAAAVLLLSATHARAQTKDAPQQQAEPSPKRPIPNYDGRGPAPASPEDIALWPLRIVFSPLYFISEYVLRRPIGAIVTAAERGKVPEKLYDFFAFGPDHKIGFVPVGFVEFGFNPSVGIWGFWNDAFTANNDITMHYEVWPDDWLAGKITDRWRIDDNHTLQLRASGFSRPDQVFYGTGPDSAQFNQSRFSERKFDASVLFDSYFWRRTHVEVEGGIRKVDLSPGHYGSDPSLEVEARTGVFQIPFGFDRGYLAPYGRALASFDTRRRGALHLMDSSTAEGSGFRLQGQAEVGGDVEHSPASGWVRWGGAATLFVDLNEHGRVLSLSAATEFADPVGDQPIPFTELVMLGGDNWFHGFFPNRLIDRSMAVAQAEYTWPVAPWLLGTLQAAVGNVFGDHLEGFDGNKFRLSTGLGLTTTTEFPVQMLIGFGTDTFDRGANIDSFRVSFGVPRSF